MDKTLLDYAQHFLDIGLNFEKCTCLDCGRWRDCPYAFDIYNYDGDCIMEK